MSAQQFTDPPISDVTQEHRGGGELSWWGFGLANLGVVSLISLLSWYLFVDPGTSPLKSYPQPFNALLFWGILAVVWLGFNLEFSPFGRLKQPIRGIIITISAMTISAVITLALAYGWGVIDSSFSAGRAGGAGYQAGSLWVLFGFLTYVMAAINWNHWPWSGRIRQPWLGVAEVGLLVVPTSVLYGVFALPTLATWLGPSKSVMTTNTAIGWFYAMIVSVIITGSLLDNWPWRLARVPSRIALAATVGNVAAGTMLYFGGEGLASLLIGPANTSALGDGITSFPAEIGVCWVFWAVIWANAFGNWPVRLAAAPTYVLRVLVTLMLGIATFCLYYFILAEYVLDEPKVVGSISGNALGWMDWMIFWALIYILCFGSFGLKRPRGDSEKSV
jgi:amino acid transporter, AAT family